MLSVWVLMPRFVVDYVALWHCNNSMCRGTGPPRNRNSAMLLRCTMCQAVRQLACMRA